MNTIEVLLKQQLVEVHAIKHINTEVLKASKEHQLQAEIAQQLKRFLGSDIWWNVGKDILRETCETLSVATGYKLSVYLNANGKFNCYWPVGRERCESLTTEKAEDAARMVVERGAYLVSPPINLCEHLENQLLEIAEMYISRTRK